VSINEKDTITNIRNKMKMKQQQHLSQSTIKLVWLLVVVLFVGLSDIQETRPVVLSFQQQLPNHRLRNTWSSSSSSSSLASTPTNGEQSTPVSPPSLSAQFGSSSSSSGSADRKESDKALREEIAARNSMVDNEEQYTIRDGEGVSAPTAVMTTTATTTTTSAEDKQQEVEDDVTTATVIGKSDGDDFENMYERLIRQRPYLLFLLEKGIEIVEDTVEGVLHKFDGSSDALVQSGSDTVSIHNEKPRERVVVLGTGWGAAAFVKNIDTTICDVTVISPRNYFLFTPMLAGASVGTVDYRSITQPIREVRPVLPTKLFGPILFLSLLYLFRY
jgi:hypothetical protein